MAQFGFSLIMRGSEATPESFVQMAERAEALELDSLWCSAHIIIPPQLKSDYIMVPGSKHPEHWKERYWEPFTVLSHLAATTKRVKLGTSVTVLPMHNPFEIAKQVAEVDQLSGGRFIFGVGVGWFEEEFEVLGQSYRDRGARTDDALRLMRTLWTEEPVSYEGRYYRVENAFFSPKPVQSPHPPVWIAGSSDAALKRVARYADAWHPVRPSFEHLEEARLKIARYCETEGRDAETIDLAVKLPLTFQDTAPADTQFATQGRPTDIVDGIKRLIDAGADHFVLDVNPEKLSVTLDTMERFAEEVRPKL